ncbi:MAG: dienelactone hydrolase [Alphaproteobacteria bacterium]|nr:dienelactone hydrolase [Alphaproteobacteria bacterium]
MAKGVGEAWDRLEDFEKRSFSHDGVDRNVFAAGSGPGVIIIHEIPGITPEVARFARMVRDAGFRVFLPSLLGAPGKPNSPNYLLQSSFRACVAREFVLFADNRTSPIVDWLKALAQRVKAECGGRGVGALGMCLTGNFALAMMVEPAVTAPVLCQPSLPANKPDGLGLSPQDVTAVRTRLETENLRALGYRFEGDSLCRAARFTAFSAAFGPRFQAQALPDSAAKPDTFMRNPHSVVTTHLVDERGSVTREKVDEIIAFFRDAL